jgi:hypothetical protein
VKRNKESLPKHWDSLKIATFMVLRHNKYLKLLWERKLIQRNTNRNYNRSEMDMNIQEKEGPWL